MQVFMFVPLDPLHPDFFV